MNDRSLFRDRQEAAKKLAAKLERYRKEDPLVLGIPTGGAELGYYLACEMDAEFSVIITKKIPGAEDPDVGIGAVCEEGTVFLDEQHKGMHHQLETEILRIRSEILRRILLYRDGKPLPEMKNRVVVLADDIIYKGVSAAAAFLLCVRLGASRVIIAAPVASSGYCTDLEEADELVILHKLEHSALKETYSRRESLTDEEVLRFVRRYQERVGKGV
jgi:putative phosphoribosyl transferase